MPGGRMISLHIILLYGLGGQLPAGSVGREEWHGGSMSSQWGLLTGTGVRRILQTATDVVRRNQLA